MWALIKMQDYIRICTTKFRIWTWMHIPSVILIHNTIYPYMIMVWKQILSHMIIYIFIWSCIFIYNNIIDHIYSYITLYSSIHVLIWISIQMWSYMILSIIIYNRICLYMIICIHILSYIGLYILIYIYIWYLYIVNAFCSS